MQDSLELMSWHQDLLGSTRLAMLFGAIAVFSLFAARSSANPQSAVPDTELESVTVEAQRRKQRIDEQVSEFVYSIAGPAKVESLARWNVPVCVATAGLTAAEADFVKKRIAQIATDADVAVGWTGLRSEFRGHRDA